MRGHERKVGVKGDKGVVIEGGVVTAGVFDIIATFQRLTQQGEPMRPPTLHFYQITVL